MGSCVSLHSNASSSAMKLRLPFWHKTTKLVIPASPIKEGNPSSINQFAMKSQWSPSDSVSKFHDLGSKEESFFDSQPWLESDCDDDFFSVNGDFTPSRGSTPVHHKFSTLTPQTPVPTSEPSPTDRKKRLSDLFEESMREGRDSSNLITIGNINMANGNLTPKSPYGSTYVTGTNSPSSSERNANGDSISGKQRSTKSVHCCLPSLVTCRSFNESKKRTSPALRVNDNP